MANLIIIVDPDPERRTNFINKVRPLLPPFTGLVTNSCTTGNFASIWAANSQAPISHCTNNNGAAVVWGNAITHDSTEQNDAESLQQKWHPVNNNNSFPTFDGFYAATVYHPQHGLIVGADLLGFFPLYYYTDKNVALIGSSPELFRYHPNFNTKFNPQGLVGLLLLRHLVDEQTLWSNAKRLGAGNILQWKPKTGAQELEHYRLPCSSNNTPYSHLSFSEHLDILDEAIDQAIARHTATSKKHNFLLSGGLDSRMLAGFLQRQGIEPVAFTLGNPGDMELECATAVTHHLGWKHRVVSTPMNKYPFYANFVVNWEHLAGGFSGTTGMVSNAHFYLQNSPGTIINGFAMDGVIGSLKSSDISFQSTFHRHNSSGFPPEVLNKLLNQDIFGNSLSETVTLLHENYESYSALEWQKIWCFTIYYFNRFVLGTMAWEISFGAWPILPILDRQLLETVIRLPISTLNNRKAQKELVCTRFPQLAELPLDRNSWNMEPLKPSQTRQQLNLLFKLQQKWRRLQLELGYDRRHYYRIADINNAGWQAVRREAETYRSKVEHLFNMDVFNELLPPPDVKLKFKSDSIKESSG
ncbi:MAG: asparagine synthase-related protein, partial [Microcoleaceae cyanobacterium]